MSDHPDLPDDPSFDDPSFDDPSFDEADPDAPLGSVPPPPASSSLPESGPGSLAPLWARAVARTVDLFIVFAAASIVLNATGVVEMVDEEVVTSNPFVALLVLFGVWGLYEVAGTVGQSRMVGKLLMGLRVRTVEADRSPKLSQLVRRWLLPAITVLVPLGSFQFLVVAMVYLSALLTPQMQGFHDRWAKTLVVRAR